jgi:glycosyltransferase involved in cell wall biosynthesis
MAASRLGRRDREGLNVYATNSRPLRVCFFSPLLWPVWSGGTIAFAGGAELQQARLARGLAERGLEVTVVTCDFGQPSPVNVHGVRVLKTYRPADGLPVLRFFHPRLTRSLSALGAADADVYYVRCASLEAGIAFDVARSRGAAFVFAAAHEDDARRSPKLLPNPRDRWWYARALRGADAVIAQTEVQREMFRREWGRDSTVIRNLVDLPPLAGAGTGETVVWLSTYKPAKRPEWFVDLARALPQHRFVMAGVVPPPPETQEAWVAAQDAARALPNLEVRGFLGAEQVGELYRDAGLFVHTSPAEGFPNTLLEAWAHGLPGVSCVDPDGVVARHSLGEVVSDRAGLVRAVNEWMASPDRRREAGARARRYAEDAHAPGVTIAAVSEVLAHAAASKVARSGSRSS